MNFTTRQRAEPLDLKPVLIKRTKLPERKAWFYDRYDIFSSGSVHYFSCPSSNCPCQHHSSCEVSCNWAPRESCSGIYSRCVCVRFVCTNILSLSLLVVCHDCLAINFGGLFICLFFLRCTYMCRSPIWSLPILSEGQLNVGMQSSAAVISTPELPPVGQVCAASPINVYTHSHPPLKAC